jgi:diacylglycerol kinase family enzyme
LKKLVSLFHNPDAGSSDHTRKELRTQIEEAGFSVIFSTTDADEVKKIIPDKTDYVAIAGGDGMVRKVVDQMLNRKLIDGTFTVGVIPLGTANNIARTLDLPLEAADAIERWKKGKTRRVDVARLVGIKDKNFFLEGLGCGLIPRLIKDMRDLDNKPDTPEKELAMAVDHLLKLAREIKPCMCTIEANGTIFKGKVLMVEVMNMKTIGPNLPVAHEADPSDGQLDVVYVTEDDREALIKFLEAHTNGNEIPLSAHRLISKDVRLVTEDSELHVDDKLHEAGKEGVTIDLRPGLLEFLV